MPRKRRHRNRSSAQTSPAADTSGNGTLESAVRVPAKQVNSDDVGQPPKKKRKNSSKKRSKKQAVYRQDSSTFGALCPDVLIEIFSYLKPLDLLHLSWISKGLHSLLMSDSLVPIWKRARTQNILEGIPDCPPGIKEPLYANLMFSNYCFFCLKQEGKMEVNWRGRFRTCYVCVKKKTLFTLLALEIEDEMDCSDYGEHLSDVDGSLFGDDEGEEEQEWFGLFPGNVLRRCLPSIRPWKNSNIAEEFEYSEYELEDRRYHIDTYKRWKQEYEASMDKKQWRKTKLDEQMAISTHNFRCRIWKAKYDEYVIEERKNMILKLIAKLGWQRELGRATYSEHPLQDPIIEKAYNRTLTDTGLASLEPRINTVMGKIRAKWLAIEHPLVLAQRLNILIDTVGACWTTFPPNALIPNVGDVFLTPLVLDIMNSNPEGRDLTQDNFIPLIEAYPEIAREWRLDKEAELVEMIRSSFGKKYPFNSDTVLHLATTIFSCTTCQSHQSPIWYPRVLIHGHAIGCQCNVQGPSKPHAHGTPWNTGNQINISRDESLIMSKALGKLGFDPSTITKEEMDKLDPIFECVECNDPRRGRFTMKWTHLARHIYIVHSGKKPYKIEMLEEQDAHSVRARFAEDNSFDKDCSDDEWVDNARKSMICVHCRQMNKPASLSCHLWKRHGVAEPTVADIVPNLDIVPHHHYRYSWPARKSAHRCRR